MASRDVAVIDVQAEEAWDLGLVRAVKIGNRLSQGVTVI